MKVIFLILFCSSITAYGEITKCSQAESNVCGKNAECHDEKDDLLYQRHNGPYCKCLPGIIGMPPNCKEPCSSHSNCKKDEYCDANGSGDCVKGCRDSRSCKTDEFCDHLSKKCMDGCRNDKSCEDHQFCDITTKKCTKGCTNSNHCSDDEYCDLTNNVFPGKCLKICIYFSCGINENCAAKDQIRFCSCIDGFEYVNTQGCQKKPNVIENRDFKGSSSNSSVPLEKLLNVEDSMKMITTTKAPEVKRRKFTG
ncbi:hypothetical protein ACKWTF_014472 [Chironomus riparius]